VALDDIVGALEVMKDPAVAYWPKLHAELVLKVPSVSL